MNIAKKKLFHIFILLAAAGIFLLTCISFFVPSAAAFILSFLPQKAYALYHSAPINYSFIGRVFRFTVLQAFCSAVLAIPIGIATAFFCARRQFFGRNLLLGLSAIPLSIPPMIIALAFILFFGRNGFANTLCMQIFSCSKPPFGFLYSKTGLIIAQAFYNFPIAMSTIAKVWANLPEEEEQAALLLGANRLSIFFTITLPALYSAIAFSFLMIFLYCFFSFILVLMFGGIGTATLEVELYQAARVGFNLKQAGFIGIIETLTALCILFLTVTVQKSLSAKNIRIKEKRERLAISGTAEKAFFFLVMSIIFFFLLAPLFSIMIHSILDTNHVYMQGIRVFTVRAWQKLITSTLFWRAFFNTIIVGACTASLALITAVFFIFITQNIESERVQKIKTIFPFLPFAVSSLMFGLGWTILHPAPSVIVLILAQTALAWPFAWTQIQTSYARIPETCFHAALLLSGNKIEAFLYVSLPLCKSGLLTAFAFVFAVSAGDASLPLVLSIPDFDNLSLLLFRFSGSYRFAESSAVAVVLAILTGFIFILSQRKRGA
ncbi:ABC transporter permease [Treponema phagedenis]|uniref:ABC transporter permease n=1 Tax=Treponema phagedenis TaxID=162 RepID=UPI0011E612DB|nr:iron ABC transporter permease [Treponema phagedenis]QEK06965.1 iron ABC transporter permease [Treponema phagedenis]